MAVQESRIPFAVTEITSEARRAADRVLASGWVTTGEETRRFEEEFASYVEAEHAVAVSSCTAALELSLTGPPGAVLRALGDADVAHLQVREPTLEEIFLDYYGSVPA